MPKRLAFIIGNDDYSKNKLQNCINDATQLAQALKDVSYTVYVEKNLKSTDMYKCIKTFVKLIKPDDFVIFFFADHGVQWGDQNFLLPCDNEQIDTGDDMQRFAINAQWTVDQIATQNPHVVIILLDCCREYWVPKQDRGDNQSIGGLQKMTAPPGSLISFACAPGKITPDRAADAQNGIFTKYLLKHIKTPDTDIEFILRRVANDVAEETKKQQQPFRVSSITEEDVYVVPSGNCLLFHFSILP
jgi:uncharacterized caspase-like protein